MDREFFRNGEKKVIWKRSQHLRLWKQRQMQFIDNAVIATAKEQTMNGWSASFEIKVADIKKLTIYPAEYVHDHLMVKIRLMHNFGRTYFADKERVAF